MLTLKTILKSNYSQIKPLLVLFSAVLVHRFPAWLYVTFPTLLSLLLILPFFFKFESV